MYNLRNRKQVEFLEQGLDALFSTHEGNDCINYLRGQVVMNTFSSYSHVDLL